MANRSSKRSNRTKPKEVGLKVRALSNGIGWVFVPPRAATERLEDLAEVRAMIEADELEIATEELRWLLSGCSEMLEAHVMLAQIAAESENDVQLARAHFGFAFQLGEKAIMQAQCPGPLLGSAEENAPWYEAARGLAWCFEKQGRSTDADQIASSALRFDPSDPTEIRAMLDELRSGGLPVVELG